MSENKTKVGVIGLSMGQNHVVAYKNIADAEMLAVCDWDEPWLKHMQTLHTVPRTYLKYEDLLADKDIEAVSVCLPTSLHAPATIAALKAGKHVLCEKPMSTTARDAQAMAAAAKETGKVLMISHNQRFTPQAQYIKRLVEQGRFGKIYFVRAGWRRPMGCLPSANSQRATGTLNRNWFNERAKGGGVLFDLGSHMLDLSMWFMGFPKIEKIAGMNYSTFLPAFSAAHKQSGDAEDLAAAMLFFQGGASLQLEVSFGSFVEQETVFVELYGSEGGVSLRNGVLKLIGEDQGAYTTTTVGKFNLPVQSPQENFVQAVRTGKGPLVTAEHGVAVTTVLEGIRECGIVPGDPKGKVYS